MVSFEALPIEYKTYGSLNAMSKPYVTDSTNRMSQIQCIIKQYIIQQQRESF
jgi:hypothetical protein